MESVLVKVVSFIAVIVVGYLLKRVGFFRAEDFRLIAGLVLKVTLPCAIISNFTRIDVDAALFVLVLLGLGCNLVTVAAGWLASKRGDSAEQAFNIINFSGYNVGCFALPFLQSFVSPMGVVAACIWDTGNSIMCTGATYSIAAAVAGKNEGGGARLFFRRMFSSVPMDVYVAMTILAFLGWQIHLPDAVTTFAGILGNANPFLAMLMIGIGFELKLAPGSGLHIAKTLFCRYLIAAALAFLFYNYLPFDQEVRKVLAILAFAPLSAVCTIYTALCLNDPGRVALSCTLNSLSIVCSVTFMTVLVVWL